MKFVRILHRRQIRLFSAPVRLLHQLNNIWSRCTYISLNCHHGILVVVQERSRNSRTFKFSHPPPIPLYFSWAVYWNDKGRFWNDNLVKVWIMWCDIFPLFLWQLQHHSATILLAWNQERSQLHESPPHQLIMHATQHPMGVSTERFAGSLDIKTATSGLRWTLVNLQRSERLWHRAGKTPINGLNSTGCLTV